MYIGLEMVEILYFKNREALTWVGVFLYRKMFGSFTFVLKTQVCFQSCGFQLLTNQNENHLSTTYGRGQNLLCFNIENFKNTYCYANSEAN